MLSAHPQQHNFCYLPLMDVLLAQRGFPAENIILFCVTICTELLGFLTAQTCRARILFLINTEAPVNFGTERKTSFFLGQSHGNVYVVTGNKAWVALHTRLSPQ